VKKRILYPLIIGVVLLVIHLIIQPFLFNLYIENSLSLFQYRLIYLSINLAIIVALSLILLLEGKVVIGVREVSGLVVLNVVMDIIRLYIYPTLAIKENLVTFFAGVIIFAFGLVAIKSALYKKGAGFIFIILGIFYILRFPVFIDILFYINNQIHQASIAAEKYFTGTVNLNYISIILLLLALDRILQNNVEMTRFPDKKLNQ
jgi:hypothetical protein